MQLHEIKEQILLKYDPDDICDSLQITSEELLDAFEHKLIANICKFEFDSEIDLSEYIKDE